MSWLLDTDVICQPAKRHGDARVIGWLHQERDRCFTSAIVIAQLAYWVRSKEGRPRRDLQDWLRRLVDDRNGKRQGLPPARLDGLQSVQGTASGLKRHKAGNAEDGTVFQ